jgi:pimeloyl-ACP methyl ester carboxylesterase
MNWAARANLGLARHAPHLARLVFGHAAGGFLSFWPRSVEHFRSIAASDADRDTLQDANTRQVLNQTVRDAVRDGAQGALQDLFLYTREWGIPMDEIAPRVQIWHGMDDGTVPVSHSRWYAQHLPHGDLRLFPGEGHFSLPLRYAAEILQGLMDT